MTTTIPNNQSKRKIINDLIKKQEEDSKTKGESLPRAKLTVKGRTEYASIYSLPVKELYFNKANGRIKAEIIEKESEFGRDFDIWNDIDQNEIKKILLSIRTDENEKIKKDIIKNGQTTPGIVTCDGILINGNRRKALIESLYDETHEEKYKYIDVQVLPSDISKQELWLIEAGIQLSAQQQLDYSPINNLLKLREGQNSGLEVEEMSSRLYGVSEDKIKSDLERLDLIDEYLCDFVGKKGKYYLVKNLNEHFIDLQIILNWAEKPRGKKIEWDNGITQSDINELKLIGFYYIRMKMPHLRIRELRDHFAIQTSWLEQRKVLEEIEIDLTSEEKKSGGIIITKEIEDDNDTEELLIEDIDNPILSTTEEKDLQEEQIWKKNRESKLKTIYEDSKEQEKIHKDQEKPLELAKRALKNIMGIKIGKDDEYNADLDKIMGKIIVETNKRKKFLFKKRQ